MLAAFVVSPIVMLVDANPLGYMSDARGADAEPAAHERRVILLAMAGATAALLVLSLRELRQRVVV